MFNLTVHGSVRLRCVLFVILVAGIRMFVNDNRIHLKSGELLAKSLLAMTGLQVLDLGGTAL